MQQSHAALYAAYAIGSVYAGGGSTIAKEVTKGLLAQLSKMLRQGGDESEVAARAVGAVYASGGDRAIAKEVTERFLGQLSKMLEKGGDAAEGAAYAIGKVLEGAEVEITAGYLKHDKSEFRQTATKALLPKLKQENTTQQDVRLIKHMLQIIADDRADENDQEGRELQKLAKKLLYKQLEFFGDMIDKNQEPQSLSDDVKLESVDEEFSSVEKASKPKFGDAMMQYVNANFEELINLSSETKAFFREVLHKALADGNISELDKEFIIKCIKNNITVSVTKNSEIIFEGRIYEFASNDHQVNKDNQKYIDEIAMEALAQENILALQYREHEPIFNNQEWGIRKAAADIKGIKSFVTGEELTSDSRQISLLHLSNHNKDFPAEVFLLIEGRDAFGRIILHKIGADGRRFDNIPEDIHPNDVSEALLRSLFGNMLYTADNIPRYYVSSFTVGYDKAQELLDEVDGHLHDNAEEKGQGGIIETEISLKWWKDYVGNSATQELDKVTLFRLNPEEAAKVKRDSIIIKYKFKVDVHGRVLDEHDQIIIENVNDIERLNLLQEYAAKREAEALVPSGDTNLPSFPNTPEQPKSFVSPSGNAVQETDDDFYGVLCVILSLNNIKYDKELLNKPELLSDAIKLLGINRTLGLIDRLDEELVQAAINHDDATLILAGVVSLDLVDHI